MTSSTPSSSPPTGTGCAPPPRRASRSLTSSPSRSSTSSSPTRCPTTTPSPPRPSRSLGPPTVRPSLPVCPTTPSESGPSYNCEAAHERYVDPGRASRKGTRDEHRWDEMRWDCEGGWEKRRGGRWCLFFCSVTVSSRTKMRCVRPAQHHRPAQVRLRVQSSVSASTRTEGFG